MRKLNCNIAKKTTIHLQTSKYGDCHDEDSGDGYAHELCYIEPISSNQTGNDLLAEAKIYY